MVIHEAFGTNGNFDIDGGLTKSLFDSVPLNTFNESNSAFNGLSRQLRASAASDPFASQLDRLEKLDTRADIRANSSSAVDNDFDNEFFFDESRFLTGVPYQIVRNTKLDSTTDFNILTGKSKETPLVDITGYDSLTNSFPKRGGGFAGYREASELTGGVINPPPLLQEKSVTGIQGAKTRASSPPTAPTTYLMAEATSQTVDPTFAVRSEGTVSINGGGDFDGNPVDPTDDALIHGAKGFTINGNPVLPVQRDGSGNPILDQSGKPLLVNNAVTVAQGYTVSNAPGNRYANLLPPQVVQKQTVNVPAYSDVKQQELASTIPSGTQTVTFNAQANPINNASQWASKFPGNGYSGHPTVVRVTNGGLNIPSNVDLSHIVITVENGDINFNGSGHDLDKVVLVTNNGNINLASVRANDLSVFASGSINTNGGVRFAGETMLANGSSGGNIAFNGATATTNATDNLTVISQGDITYNGASSTRGSFSSVKNFTFNGNSTLLGEIGAKGNIIFNGKATVTAAFTDPIPPAITALLANDTAPGGTTNTDRITSDPTITGTIADASAVTAFRAGFDNTPTSSFVNVLNQLSAQGNFTLSRPELEQVYGRTLSDGVYTLRFVAQDQYGNVSNLDFTFTLDTQSAAPTGLNLNTASDSGTSSSDRITNVTTPTITGNAEAGAIVQLSSSGQLVSQTTATSGGTWLLSTSNLADGSKSLTAIATDVAGNTSPVSTPLNVVIDTQAPVAPSGLKLTQATDTGASNSDNITNNTTPTIQGNADAGSLIRLFKSGQLLGQTTATANGSWQLAVAPLSDDLYTFTATAEDMAGNVSQLSDELTVTIDTTAPPAPSGLNLLSNSDSGNSNSDKITNVTTPTITGNAEAGTSVQLSSDGELVGGTTATGTGTWLLTTSNLSGGTRSLTATTIDEAGNVSTPSAPLQLTIDTVSPQLSLTTPVGTTPLTLGARLIGTVDGTGTAVTALSYRFDNLAQVPVSVNTTGEFDQQLDFTGINNGQHTLTIATTDTAGNATTSNFNVTVNLDTTPPTIAAALANDTAAGGVTNTDGITADPTITGTVTDTSAIAYLRAGFDNTPYSSFVDVTAALKSDGSFTFNRTQLEQIYGTELANGSYTLHLVAEDEYGNVSSVLDVPFTLDTTPPSVEFDLAPASDSAPVGDRQTKLDTVTLIGQTQANTSVQLQETNTTTTADAMGHFSFTGVHLDLGNNTFHVNATDVAGNTAVNSQSITRLPNNELTLIEGQSFLFKLDKSLTNLQQPSKLTFSYNMAFDGSDEVNILDAFEVALVDANGQSLVHTIAPHTDVFFNLTEGQSAALGADTTKSGNTVTLNLPTLGAGLTANLNFRLVNNDSDTQTTVTVNNLQVQAGGSGVAAATPTVAATITPTYIDFSQVSDVSPSLAAKYGRTSFNAQTKVLYSDLSIQNQGQYPLIGPLLVAVNHLSDPSIKVKDADGFTPDGLPYYDFTKLVTGNTLASGQSSQSRSLAFLNPQGIQFTYDLQILAHLNRNPVINSTPGAEALAGHTYTYDGMALS